MSQIAVRLSEEELSRLDSAVADGLFRTRADAVRAGIKMLEEQLRERRIADSYRTAYAATPLTSEETRMLDAAAALAGDAIP
jgi:Arc/MetJ-type ribon-helix-helix transcriptional regulator